MCSYSTFFTTVLGRAAETNTIIITRSVRLVLVSADESISQVISEKQKTERHILKIIQWMHSQKCFSAILLSFSRTKLESYKPIQTIQSLFRTYLKITSPAVPTLSPDRVVTSMLPGSGQIFPGFSLRRSLRVSQSPVPEGSSLSNQPVQHSGVRYFN